MQHDFIRYSAVLVLPALLWLAPTAAGQSAKTGCSADKIAAMRDVSVEKLRCECFGFDCEAATPAPGGIVAPRPGAAKPAPSTGASTPGAAAEDAKDRLPAPARRAFTLYQGRDIEGSVLRLLRQTGLDQCLSECQSDSRCAAFSFDRWNRFCYLRPVVPGEIVIEPKSVVGVPTGSSPPTSARPVQTEVYRNREFRDRGFQTSVESGYDDCRLRCEGVAACEVFTYRKDTRRCVLISQPQEHFKEPLADSGMRRQIQR